jgi:hypothetical protein
MLRIASWIGEIGGSIKRKIPLRGIVAVIRDVAAGNDRAAV